eukprot:293918_1
MGTTTTTDGTKEIVIEETHPLAEKVQNQIEQNITDNDQNQKLNEVGKYNLCCDCKSELKDWIENAKWWPNWIGFSLSIFAALISIKYDSSIISFKRWQSNILKSNINDIETIIGIACLFPIIFSLLALMEYCTNKSLSKQELSAKILSHLRGFTVFYIIAIVCFLIGSHTNLKDYGIGYAILSLFIGMLMINVSKLHLSKFIQNASKKCDFYIKCGLVLLATDFKTIFTITASGLIISWVIPPLIIIFMWYLGTKTLSISNHQLIISLATGTAICGVSAICAVGAVVHLNAEHTAIAVSILSFFTIFFMIIVPYIAIYCDFNDIVSGSWIGGSVDGTGNVIASVGILDNDIAYESATIVKMAQNLLIGFVCLIVAILFKNEEHQDEKKPINKCKFLWKKFPKFIIGFIFLSVVISVFVQPFTSEIYSKNFMSNIKQLSKWLFCFGFIGIG